MALCMRHIESAQIARRLGQPERTTVCRCVSTWLGGRRNLESRGVIAGNTFSCVGGVVTVKQHTVKPELSRYTTAPCSADGKHDTLDCSNTRRCRRAFASSCASQGEHLQETIVIRGTGHGVHLAKA